MEIGRLFQKQCTFESSRLNLIKYNRRIFSRRQRVIDFSIIDARILIILEKKLLKKISVYAGIS